LNLHSNVHVVVCYPWGTRRMTRPATLGTALRWVAVVAALGFSVVQAQATPTPIPTLFNTGVDASGTPLADHTVGDPHYMFASVPAGSPSTILVRTSVFTTDSGFPIPPWLGDDSISTWIGVDNPVVGELAGPPGLYDYRTTFDLTGFNPATASISGGWASDNDGVKILLNGLDRPQSSYPAFAGGYASFTSFSISSGFVSGLNTLDFFVHNGGTGPGDDSGDPNATGLRVEMSGTAEALPVSAAEPGTLPLVGIGLAGLYGYAALRRTLQQP
jgi:hypothetical protein